MARKGVYEGKTLKDEILNRFLLTKPVQWKNLMLSMRLWQNYFQKSTENY